MKAVKAHHNVGGLPEDLKFELVEPLKYLFKDEVRAVGKAPGPARFHGLSPAVPRPRPGRALPGRHHPRAAGDRARKRRHSSRRVSKTPRLAGKVWQYFTAVPDFKSVGVRDHARCFEYPVILRASTPWTP